MAIEREVSEILRRVRKEGDRALEHYVQKFDGLSLPASRFEVPKARWKAALKNIPARTRQALELAKGRIEAFHRAELKNMGGNWTKNLGGIRVGQAIRSIDAVGIYVPGGRYSYPSTVLMTAVPARVAGAKEIVMVTPAKNLKDEILAAAEMAGVTRLFQVGGPWAIGALAYGTQKIPRVKKIVGPGNAYVTEAKRQVFGAVGIDGLAGPSEVAIWADRSADPGKIAQNLMAQAEHGPDSISVLYSLDGAFIQSVRARVEEKLRPQVRFVREAREERILAQINETAPEHLMLAIKNPRRVLEKIQCAGAVFLGAGTPVALGDYAAGPSHVLPTGTAGRFSSGLSVKDFLRSFSVMEAAPSAAARKVFSAAQTLAAIEGLAHHAETLA